MPGSKKTKIPANMKEVPGYPGLYTPINVTRDSKREKALWAKIVRDANKLTAERRAREALVAPQAGPSRLSAAFPFIKF